MNALFESLEYENETTNTRNIGIMNLKRNCGDPVIFDSSVEIAEVRTPNPEDSLTHLQCGGKMRN